ncbi:hypothetical protein BDQ17DRAFT_1332829 [Cyathus striatus]|nr:hypothetical protein BDQ17DRAFT_1332829 [Cyathus striatus]
MTRQKQQNPSIPKIIFTILLLLILGIATSIMSLCKASAPIGGLVVLTCWPESAFCGAHGFSLLLLTPTAAAAGWAGESVLNRMRHQHTWVYHGPLVGFYGGIVITVIIGLLFGILVWVCAKRAKEHDCQHEDVDRGST